MPPFSVPLRATQGHGYLSQLLGVPFTHSFLTRPDAPHARARARASAGVRPRERFRRRPAGAYKNLYHRVINVTTAYSLGGETRVTRWVFPFTQA